jgi:hypothetical protein
VHGLYLKLVLMAADQPRELRGWILDDNANPARRQPLTAGQLAEALGWDPTRLREALGILMDPEVAMVSVCEFGQVSGKAGSGGESNAREDGQGFRKPPEVPEKSGDLTIEIEEQSNKTLFEGKICRAISSTSISDSIGQQKSALATAEIRAKALRAVIAILRVSAADDEQSRADRTTLHDIFHQLYERVKAGQAEVGLFGEVVKQAKIAAGAKVPAAAFTKRMEAEPFGYVPVGKRPRSLGASVAGILARFGF